MIRWTMAQTYARGFDPDGYDIWQAASYAGTALSAASLLSKGKQAKELGTAGTVIGIMSSVLHAVVTPPRCDGCGRRMSRLPASYAAAWWCTLCGWQKP
jgi:hypothetical protein